MNARSPGSAWPPSSQSPWWWCAQEHYTNETMNPQPHHGPLLLEDLQELTYGIHDVVGIHRGHPGHIVGVAEVLRVKEGQDHLLAPAVLHLCLDGARLALSQPLLALLLILGVWKGAVDSSW